MIFLDSYWCFFSPPRTMNFPFELISFHCLFASSGCFSIGWRSSTEPADALMVLAGVPLRCVMSAGGTASRLVSLCVFKGEEARKRDVWARAQASRPARAPRIAVQILFTRPRWGPVTAGWSVWKLNRPVKTMWELIQAQMRQFSTPCCHKWKHGSIQQFSIKIPHKIKCLKLLKSLWLLVCQYLFLQNISDTHTHQGQCSKHGEKNRGGWAV